MSRRYEKLREWRLKFPRESAMATREIPAEGKCSIRVASCESRGGIRKRLKAIKTAAIRPHVIALYQLADSVAT